MFNAKAWANLGRTAVLEGRQQDFENELMGELATMSPNEISMRSIFEHFVEDGREILDIWGRNPAGGDRGLSMHTLESAGVNTTSFSNITGQIVYNEILRTWDDPIWVADMLAKTTPTSFLDGEKIPGMTQIGDQAMEVGEGKPYPMASFGEEWVETPRTVKSGLIIPVTKEVLIHDRTGMVLERASDVSRSLRIRKEKRVIDAVLGLTPLYNRNGKGVQTTYATTHPEGTFSNLVTSNPLTDYRSVEAMMKAFAGITDPNTGDPVIVPMDTLIVTTGNLMTARSIQTATQTREKTNSGNRETLFGNPLANPLQEGQRGVPFKIINNAYIDSRAGGIDVDTWWGGQPMKAFRYMQVWPITSVAAPRNSELEFTQDIVQRYKASERGTPAAAEIRYMAKSTA